MRTIITTLLVLISTISYTQCKYKIDETDKFTGRKKLLTGEQKAFATTGQFIEFAFGQIDSGKFVQTHIGISGEPFHLSFDDKLIIIFSGGSKLTLVLGYVSDVAEGSGFYHLRTKFIITEDQLFQFQNKLIQDIRVYTSKGYIEHEGIKPKFAEAIKELANCL